MSDNTLPQPAGADLRPGQKLHVTSLAPRFDPDRHQLYYDLLERAIDDESTRNVALTGAYGTGKSSVLDQLHTTREARVVKLSLSTIAPEVHDTEATADDGGRDGRSRTNQIQKEIVKQLLYRLSPDDVPHSRFRRASVPDERHDIKLAAAAGGAAFAVLFGLGLLQPPVEGLLPEVWRQVVAYVLLLVLAVAAAWGVIRVVRARPTLSASVQTGAATVTLSKQSDTYFDEYLDEIVYFFQASRRDIVVIEDIDRFEDVQVFDTLRALNGLLNSSDQIGRRIVFVYAIRDSVFEKIGAKPNRRGEGGAQVPEDTDRAKTTLKRASRTKFFDVIIPVVPFVSADNARDVMSEVMASDEFEINPALIRLAARHVADMRMIHNIRNEFEVYRSRLVVPEDRIPGIDDDLVFAIVLFKNTHLADFEKIRHRESSLDKLYAAWRTLVRDNLTSHTQALTQHRRSRHLDATTNARAAYLGRRLDSFCDSLLKGAQAASSSATVQLTGPATSETLGDPQTWAKIAGGEPQQITLQDPSAYRQPTINLSFDAERLAHLIGATIDPEEWPTVTLQEVAAKIEHEEAQIKFLRHHTWEQLRARPDLTMDATQLDLTDPSGEPLAGPVTFDQIVGAVLDSDLARDLVRHGYLTSHFALYTSSYYGNHLGRDAMEYIRRCIEPGVPDASFSMSEAEVIQLLREQRADKSDTADLFSDGSVYNVSILDHLLAKRPGAAATVARSLCHLGTQEREFIDTYITQGEHPGALLAAMAPHWTGVVRYAAVTAPVDPAARPALLDAVLRALPNAKYDVDHDVAQVFEASFRDVDAICRPESHQQALIVLEVIRASGALLESLTPLNAAALDAAVALRLYPITEENLRVLVPEGVVALDALRGKEDAYRHALNRLEDYLALVDSVHDIHAMADPTMFATVLNDVAEHADTPVLRAFIDRSSNECRIPDLDNVIPAAWPPLAAANRTDPTYANTTAYLEHHGMDEHLGGLLAKQKKITGAEGSSQEDRLQLAVDVLAAREEIPSTTTRVALAASLKPGTIPATSLTSEKGDLVARLLRKRLIADDASTFAAELIVDWPTHEAAIVASKKYATFVSPDILQAATIPHVLRSTAIAKEIQLAVVRALPAYLADAGAPQARAIAQALVDTGWRLGYTILEALRAAGATPATLLPLIRVSGDKLSTEQLKALLRDLGGDYARVADGGRGRPTFSVSAAHEYVLNRLVGDTIKEFEAKELKSKGRQLIAHLQSSNM